MLTQSDWISRANAVLPGGGFGNFDPGIIIREGKDSRVWDEDGREYVDLLIGSGPMLLGHGHPEVMDAVMQQLPRGMTFFANNTAGIELAEEICNAVKCAEQVRYLCTGSEADMYAMRLARAFTGREKILKFEGGYHGMSAEAQMSLAPSRLVNFPLAVPDSPGIPQGVRDAMLVAPFNDIESVRSIIAEHAHEIAGIIVEPFQRILPPAPGFLEALREECDRHGIVLVFDEIVTGFRFTYEGAQNYYGVVPDVCTLGKIIGGGFALAAIAGRSDIMAHFDKAKVGADGFLMQLGTLSGAPVAAVAGLKTMEVLRRDGQYDRLKANGERLMASFSGHLAAAGHAHQVVGEPWLFDVLFADKPVKNYRDVMQADAGKNARFNDALRRNGVFKAPGKVYPSLALTDEDFELVDAAVAQAARVL